MCCQLIVAVLLHLAQIKVKVLLSMLSMKKDELNKSIQEITEVLRVAEGDSDEWVRAIYLIVRDFPTHGVLHSDLDSSNTCFSSALNDIIAAG